MPFTISHVAAVLPFARFLRRGRVLSAVVIGSMVPDFGWFLPWRPERFETHSAVALLTWSLPVGLATYWVFQYLIKTPVREVLPDRAYGRSLPYAPVADVGSLKQWLIAAVGILAGAVTHLIWDAFTHEGARGVRMVPAIDDWWFAVGAGRVVAGTRFLQDVSSLLGLVVVAWLLWRALRTPSRVPVGSRRLAPAERLAWVLAYVLTAFVVGTSALLLVHSNEPYGVRNAGPLSHVAIAGLRGMAVSALAVSACLSVRLSRRGP
jgi:hypothetical protein